MWYLDDVSLVRPLSQNIGKPENYIKVFAQDSGKPIPIALLPVRAEIIIMKILIYLIIIYSLYLEF